MSSYRKKQNRPKAAAKQAAARPEPGTQAVKPQAASGYHNPGMECPASLEREIHTDRLTSGLPYQRPVNQREVERLVREWDERLLDPITVSFRDGKFFVVDGQHRISALRSVKRFSKASKYAA